MARATHHESEPVSGEFGLPHVGHKLPSSAAGNHCAAFWTFRSIQAATLGRWLAQPPGCEGRLTGVNTDSRTVKPGQVFIALKGPRYDGHDYLLEAADAGAQVLIVSQAQRAGDLGRTAKAVLLVPDTLRALQDLARHYRACLVQNGTRVIAVTGSNGKTTTRHLIHQALSAVYTGMHSPKNFNNDIGVPLTLLAAGAQDEFVVTELGSDGPGQISRLAAIAQPDVAVVTCVGVAHLDAFGHKEAIAAEKASLLDHVRPGGLAIVPGDEPLLTAHRGRVPKGVGLWRFGAGQDNDLRLTDDAPDAGGWVFRTAGGQGCGPGPRVTFRIPLLGRHNAFNALAAVGVARWMGIDDPAIASALAGLTGVTMRLDQLRLGHPRHPLTVINDAYNASPESVAAAVAVLIGYPLPTVGEAVAPGTRQCTQPAMGRRVLVLGDMLELGAQGPGLHRELGHMIAATGRGDIHLAVLIGALSAHTAGAMRQAWAADRVHSFEAWDEGVGSCVARLVEPGDVVLIKGSRGMRLERLIPLLQRVASGWL